MKHHQIQQSRINRIKASSRLARKLRDEQKDLPLLQCKHCNRTMQRDPMPTEARLPFHYNDPSERDRECPGSYSEIDFVLVRIIDFDKSTHLNKKMQP